MYFVNKYMNILYFLEEKGYEILQESTLNIFFCFLLFSTII